MKNFIIWCVSFWQEYTFRFMSKTNSISLLSCQKLKLKNEFKVLRDVCVCLLFCRLSKSYNANGRQEGKKNVRKIVSNSKGPRICELADFLLLSSVYSDLKRCIHIYVCLAHTEQRLLFFIFYCFDQWTILYFVHRWQSESPRKSKLVFQSFAFRFIVLSSPIYRDLCRIKRFRNGIVDTKHLDIYTVLN